MADLVKDLFTINGLYQSAAGNFGGGGHRLLVFFSQLFKIKGFATTTKDEQGGFWHRYYPYYLCLRTAGIRAR